MILVVFKRLSAFLFVGVFLLCIVPFRTEADIPANIIDQKKSVVSIAVHSASGKLVAFGSGFIVDSNGLIATNYHVISKIANSRNNVLIVKMQNGTLAVVTEIVYSNRLHDVAIIRIKGKDLSPVRLSTSSKPKLGETVVVIGSPLGLETTISNGIVSNIHTKYDLIQITAPVSPGSSGSPVFNSVGDVIGIATYSLKMGQNLNFFVPIERVSIPLSQIRSPSQTNTPTQTEPSSPIQHFLPRR